MTYLINDNGKQIHMKEDLLITKQVASFKNFKIKGDISISFSVPNNSQNRDTLGYYHINQVNSPVFSSTPFNLVKNGNTLMRGLLVIEEDNGKELMLYFISGNGNWFKDLQFSLRDMRNTRHSLTWNHTNLINRVGATEGIVFPIIDWLYKGEKVDNFIADALNPGFGSDIDFQIYEYFPCVYVHSVLEAIANFSGIKIEGDVFDDKFFKTLIITPSAPDIYNPINQALLVPGDTVTVEAICPNMKAVDFLKWVCMTFGIIPVYDTYSSTLTLDILDKRVLSGDDWSSYVKEYQVKYDQVQNNYIRVAPPTDDFFDAYNETNDVQFGETNIESEKLDGQSNELYTSPFPVCYDSVSETQKLAVPYVPMYDVEDEEEYVYLSVGQRAVIGTAEFNGFGMPFDANSDKFVVRIQDDNNYYTGYHKAFRYITDLSNTKLNTYTDYNFNSSGRIFTQRVSKGNPGARVLSFIPSITSTDYNSQNFFVGDPTSYTTLSTSATAYFYKPWYSLYPVLNRYRQGLSYGAVDNYNDYSIEAMYYRYIRGMVTAPTIRTKMLLPEKVFQAFNFDFVYINTGALNGYYFVESIVNYKDSTTLCEVNLLELIRQQEENVNDQTAYLITINKTSFDITPRDITLQYEALLIDVTMITTTIDSGSVFQSSWVDDIETINLSTTGNDSDAGELSFGGDVVCTVTKTGLSADQVIVTWYKGVTVMATDTIGINQTVNTSYTYTGLVGGENLSVDITEG